MVLVLCWYRLYFLVIPASRGAWYTGLYMPASASLVAVPVIHHSRVRMPRPCYRPCPAAALPLRCCDNASVRAGLYGPVRPSARLVRSGNIVVTVNFATMILAGMQEGIRGPSLRGAGPAKRSCYI